MKRRTLIAEERFRVNKWLDLMSYEDAWKSTADDLAYRCEMDIGIAITPDIAENARRVVHPRRINPLRVNVADLISRIEALEARLL